MNHSGNVGNQGGDAGNPDGNLDIAVEMTQNDNGNDKLKKWREVEIIENEQVYKNLVSIIGSGAFLANFRHISHNVFLFLLLILNRKISVGKAK